MRCFPAAVLVAALLTAPLAVVTPPAAAGPGKGRHIDLHRWDSGKQWHTGKFHDSTQVKGGKLRTTDSPKKQRRRGGTTYDVFR